jgi:hypothetical protein
MSLTGPVQLESPQTAASARILSEITVGPAHSRRSGDRGAVLGPIVCDNAAAGPGAAVPAGSCAIAPLGSCAATTCTPSFAVHPGRTHEKVPDQPKECHDPDRDHPRQYPSRP